MQPQAIGIFDSGVGGSSIWREITQLLPAENSIFLADSLNAPYGKKSKAEIIALSIKNTEKLISMNCKIIVVACNTATTNAIQTLRSTYDIPFIGIEPAIKPAALRTKTKKVGVLATQGTLTSELFAKTSDLHAHHIELIEVVGSGLVELIEQGKIKTPEMINLLKSYLQPMLEKNIDYLVLGCSHYPYLIPVLKSLLPDHVKIIDSGEAVARQTKAILQANHALNMDTKMGTHTFYSNGKLSVLEKILQKTDQNHNISYLNF